MDMVAVLKESLGNLERIVEGVQPPDMNKPTPCANFDVRGLLNHIVGGQHLVARASEGEAMTPGAEMPDLVGDDPTTAFRQSSKLIVEAFEQPGVLERTFPLPVEMSGSDALGIAVMEAVVHGWDLARATGQDHGIPAQGAEMMLGACRQFVRDEFRSPEGHPFSTAVAIADDAPAVDRLVAFLGRQP